MIESPTNPLAVVASEHTQILQDQRVPLDVDEEQIVEYLTPSYQWTSGWNLGLFKGFHVLPAGHYLAAKAGSIQVHPFWSWETETFDRRPEETLLEEYLHLLKEAVRCRLRSRGPIGNELSGGLDSSQRVGC